MRIKFSWTSFFHIHEIRVFLHSSIATKNPSTNPSFPTNLNSITATLLDLFLVLQHHSLDQVEEDQTVPHLSRCPRRQTWLWRLTKRNLIFVWLQQEVRQKTWEKLDIAKKWSTKAIQDGYKWHLPLWRYIVFFTRRVSQAKNHWGGFRPWVQLSRSPHCRLWKTRQCLYVT